MTPAAARTKTICRICDCCVIASYWSFSLRRVMASPYPLLSITPCINQYTVKGLWFIRKATLRPNTHKPNTRINQNTHTQTSHIITGATKGIGLLFVSIESEAVTKKKFQYYTIDGALSPLVFTLTHRIRKPLAY